MKNNHLTYCLVALAAAIAAVLAFDLRPGALVYVALLFACPLMMLVMMRMMTGGHGHGRSDDHPGHHPGGRETRESTGSTA